MVSLRSFRNAGTLLLVILALSAVLPSTSATAASTSNVAATNASVIRYDGKPLNGSRLEGGVVAVELDTKHVVDGVRFYLDGKPGAFVRPEKGGITADLTIEGDGTHVVTAELFRKRQTIEVVDATLTVGNHPKAVLLHDGAPLHGLTHSGGLLPIELDTALAVDGVRFRVDGDTGPFVRPVDGRLRADVTVDGEGAHMVSAQLFRNRKPIEVVEAALLVKGPDESAPVPEPEPAPAAETAASLVHAGGSLDGATIEQGTIDVGLDTELAIDGVRFRINGKDGPFARPADGRIATRLTFEADGTHVVSAELFSSQKTIETVEAIVRVVQENHPDPAPHPEPDLGADGVQLGLHVSADELDVWRSRAANGPYRTRGDVSSNSPGDWDRIAENAQAFLEKPSAGRWNGPVSNNPKGCVKKGPNEARNPRYVPQWKEATELRDAAFVALVEDSRKHALAVKTELLAQARERGVAFADRSRFCHGALDGDDNPVFNIANWVTRLLFAYDYVTIHDDQLFTSSERREMDKWFFAAAKWMQPLVDEKLDELFADRESGDYRLTSSADTGWKDRLYQGGPEIRTLQRRYNNRMAVTIRFVTLVGVAQDDASFKNSGKAYVKELLQFGYYPEGVVGEFQRWTSSDPTRGWKYAVEQAGSMLTIADVLARAGDTSLYEYTTTNGALGTAGTHHLGGPKSLRRLVTDLYHYVDGTYRRKTPGGDLIDPTDANWIHDTMLASANVYYKDSYAASIYTRKAAPGYPSKPRQSQGDSEGGEWGIYPGMLFMFGQTEGLVNPY